MNQFLKSLFLQPPTVLGRQLKPFSAFHLAALTIINNPYAVGGKVEDNDLITAVHVCSHTFTDGWKVLNPDAEALEAIGEWGAENSNASISEAHKVLSEYLTEALDVPEVWTDSNSQQSDIPLSFCVVATVIGSMPSISRVEAWDMAFAELIGYRCAIAEQNGMEIVSARQRTLIEFKNKIEREAREAADKAGK